ncbi:MAG: exonuclease subunit SbcD, partial [Alteromonadales bacterium]|nr:exonuclease subunit SbcD [Alteromonadales bacterium]
MRIIHTSDWHLGQYFYGKSRANEHQQFLSWLLSQVSQHDIDAIIVAGDIFDTSTPPSYAREMYFDFIAKLHKTSCQLIILAGNHDSVAMLSESQAVLTSLSTRVITHVIPVSCDITEQDQGQEQSAINQQVFTLKDSAGQVNAIVCAIPFVR